ncbi:hypothetical protein M2347_002684 [Chryseobacterium sp. H1D6B]|uniref:hypothetical protein n=1 Tax=Chryseobacterium sp. H1D6B TaxID=2940588 RepID=UPI0015CCE887|nr:hypothetical protein [Chryseobacterium sp. H1D6B]MDH6252957.1 hypothetical protein [Chryseobacterium sp. H1D6B]
MEIISKFTVGSDQGIDELFDVMAPVIRNTYKNTVPSEKIEEYIKAHLNARKMINTLNNLSNQLIMVYADHQPAGYSLIKGGSTYPGASEGERMTELGGFAVLPEYDSPELRSSLWKKTRSAIQFTDSIWINIIENDTLLPFLKECGFGLVENTVLEPFSSASYIYRMKIG